MFKKLLAALVLLAGAAFGQSGVISDSVIDPTGKPVKHALVYVCGITATGSPCSPTSNIYSDSGLTQQLLQPYTTDNFGNYTLWVGPGNYQVQAMSLGGNIVTKYYTVSAANGVSTSTTNTWTAAQIESWKQRYPITAYGATSGNDATSAMNSIGALIPSSSSGTMYFPAGTWKRTTVADFTTGFGYLNLFGNEDGYGQFQTTLQFSPTGTPCIQDTNSAFPYVHSLYLKGFQLVCGSGATDGIYFSGMGNLRSGIDKVSVWGSANDATRFSGTGSAFHFNNSFTTSASRLFSSGGDYGLNLDGSNEFRVRDSQFTQARIANIILQNGGVTNHLEADFSWVGAPSGGTCSGFTCGGIAGLWVKNGQQGGSMKGYFETGTGSFANNVGERLEAQTIGFDASKVWQADQDVCIDFGVNNTCPKGQGYSGSYHGVAYTNLWPDSSSVSSTAMGTLGFTVSNFTATHDCTSNPTLDAKGCAYKLVTTSASNAFFGFASYAMTDSHWYMLRGLVWADQPYYRTQNGANGPEFEAIINGSGGGGFPSSLTAPYVDTIPREFCLVTQVKGTGNGSVYVGLVNSAAGGSSLWVTDITFADVSSIHGSNVCEYPYVQTIGTGTATYSSAVNAPLTNLTGTDVNALSAPAGAIGNGNVITGDANGGGHDSGVALSSLAGLAGPQFSGNVGIGAAGIAGSPLHVYRASSGATPNSGEKMIVVEDNTNSGMSLLVPDANTVDYALGTPANPLGALFRWDKTNLKATIGTNSTGAALDFNVGLFSNSIHCIATGLLCTFNGNIADAGIAANTPVIATDGANKFIASTFPPQSFPIILAVGGTTWTNQPAAVTEFEASTSIRVQKDLSRFSQFRLIVSTSAAGATGAKIGIQYSTNGGSTWSYLETGGGTSHEVAITTPGSPLTGSWTTMDAGAQADVQLRIIGVNGDAATSPSFRNIILEVK